MSPSELRYLIASNELAEGDRAVRQKDVADRLRVSKVSAYNAIERLKEKGLLEKNERCVVLTEVGKNVLGEYMTIIGFYFRASFKTLRDVGKKSLRGRFERGLRLFGRNENRSRKIH